MKNLFIAIIALFLSISANAQHKISSPSPDLDVKITQCVETKGTVTVDMVMTNLGGEQDIYFYGTYSGTIAYDDEGNIYNSDIVIGYSNKTTSDFFRLNFPTNVPIKIRVQINKVAPEASKFLVFKLAIEMGNDRDTKILEIKNLTFNRK